MHARRGVNDSKHGAPAAGRRRYVAVLFIDLSGSTALSASLDADIYADILAAVHDRGTGIIAAHGGTVAQIYGDGMLALFQGGTGTIAAIEAALAMHAAVAALAVPGVPARSLRLHSGVHSGLVLLRAGDAVRGSVEAVGRTTSIAARLSAAARAGEVLVSAGSLGPGAARFRTGAPRAIDIGDGTPPVSALPVLGAQHDDTQPAPPVALARALVGRDAPLAALNAALAGLGQGLAFRIAIAAPAGQGKSRLAQAFAEQAAAAGVAVFQGTCSAAAAVGPLAPFRQIHRALTPSAPAADAVAETLIADIAGRLAEQPMLLILDDWQWADAASVSVLARLRDLHGALGLVLLSREADAGALPLDGFASLDLPPLTVAETAALVASRRPAFDPLDAQRIHARAGGNPLYIEELCRLDPRQAGTILAGGADALATGWLAALVGARVEALPELAQRLLEIAAVIGQVVPRWLLTAMVGDATVAALLPRLIDGDFVRATEAQIEFTHGITWEIIYSLIPLAVRRQRHAAVADTLIAHRTATAIDREESLAWHFLASEQPSRSWPYAEAAGDRAVRLGSLDRAQFHYRMAIDTLAQLPDAERDAARDRGLVGKYGYVCIFDAAPAQFPVLAAAIERARARGDTVAEAEAEYWLGYVAHGCGHNRAAIGHCVRALALVADAPDAPFAVQVRATLGQCYAVATDYARAIPLLDEAIAIKRRHRSGPRLSTGLAYSLAQRAAVHADMGDFAAARGMMAEALAGLDGSNAPVEASVLAWAAAVAAWEGDWPALLALATRGCDVAVRIEAVYIHAICRAFAAFARWKMGGCDAAADALVAAVDCMVDRGKYMSLSIAWGFLAEVEVARGNGDAARRAVAGAFDRARAGDPMGVGWAARAWAVHLAPTRPARAQVYLTRAWINARQRRSRPEAARCLDIEMLLAPAAATPPLRCATG